MTEWPQRRGHRHETHTYQLGLQLSRIEIGYSRAVVQGEWIFVSGTTGFDYSTMTISDDLAEQTEQCLKNIATALAQAG